MAPKSRVDRAREFRAFPVTARRVSVAAILAENDIASQPDAVSDILSAAYDSAPEESYCAELLGAKMTGGQFSRELARLAGLPSGNLTKLREYAIGAALAEADRDRAIDPIDWLTREGDDYRLRVRGAAAWLCEPERRHLAPECLCRALGSEADSPSIDAAATESGPLADAAQSELVGADVRAPRDHATLTPPLRPATDAQIDAAIRRVYDAVPATERAPNLVETARLVRAKLSIDGCQAAWQRIQDRAKDPQFGGRRREAGKHKSKP